MSEENQDPIDRQEEEQEPVVEWFIQVGDGKKAGPVSFERLQNFAQRGKIQPTTNVRSTEPDATWLPAADVPDLFPGLPSEEPKEEAETVEPEPEAPVEEEPVEAVSVEEESTDDVEVTDDSQAVKTPKALIDLGRKKDEKPTEKPKAKKVTAFVIDTGGASKKKDDESVEENPPAEEAMVEPIPEKKEASSPGVKISIGAPAGKKDAKKEAKKEKSSTGFKFAIDPGGSKKKEEKAEEKPAEPVAAPESVKPTEPEKKKDASSAGVKISIGTPAAKKKTGDKSSVGVSVSGKSAEKSASAFRIAVKAEATESKDADTKKSDESTVISTKPKMKRDDEDTDASTDFELKTPKTGFLGMRILGILSALLGTFGGLALGFLSYKSVGPAFGATLAVVLAFFGVLLCLALQLIADFLSRHETPG